MKLLLINDEGKPLAASEDFSQYDDRSPAQLCALLDVLEKLLESATRERGEASSGAEPR
jgi:hypothetical protein